MRRRAGIAVFAVCALAAVGAQGQTPRDVPAQHWARNAVMAVVSRGVMSAPNGRFDGGRKVTRTELAITLTALARSLEQGKWPKEPAAALKAAPKSAEWTDRPVTRFELAVVLDRAARYAAHGLPRRGARVYGESDAIPTPVTLTGVPRSNPAYSALSFLAKNRMVWPRSVLLKPGPQPVTSGETAEAVAEMLVGLNDRLTDEPQNREEISPPPHKH